MQVSFSHNFNTKTHGLIPDLKKIWGTVKQFLVNMCKQMETELIKPKNVEKY